MVSRLLGRLQLSAGLAGGFPSAPSVGLATRARSSATITGACMRTKRAPTLPAYHANGGVGWEAGLRTSYYLTKNTRLAVSVNYERLQDSVALSPHGRAADMSSATSPELAGSSDARAASPLLIVVLLGATAPAAAADPAPVRLVVNRCCACIDKGASACAVTLRRALEERAGGRVLPDATAPSRRRLRCWPSALSGGHQQQERLVSEDFYFWLSPRRWRGTRRRGENRGPARGLRRPAARAAHAACLGCPMTARPLSTSCSSRMTRASRS